MHAKTLVKTVIVTALATAAAAHAAGQVEVSFPEKAQFTDAGTTAMDRSRTREALAAHLKQLGARLPDGQTLKVEITDIDLAGWTRWTSQGDIRVLRGGADWPRIALRYELLEQGRSLKAGEDELKDLNYLAHAARQDGDLPYEKRLLADWFGERFASTPR